MSIHKLTAGSGYDYLTRQVAAMDATEKGHTGLASYYTEKGETPGVWMGSGMEHLDGLDAGDVVTADQMQSLFGAGHHPLAAQRNKEFDQRIGRPGQPAPTDAERKAATRLGAPYKVYDNDVSTYRVEVAKRFAEFNEAAGLPGDWPVPAKDRAQIRTEVGREMFVAEHGREPHDARELAAAIAKHSRPKTTAVAGYDLTFSPVKSVSTLWAVADQKTAAVIEQAHHAAVRDAIGFLEKKALFTRQGTNGVRQVNVRGLLATAFTHRDSRAGDPDLHTHVAVANKVQTLDGKWLAIDGRVLFKATVAASETYNTALEKHLGKALGLQFAERPNEDARKRPIREVVGVDPELNRRFSKRRANVEDRRKVLATEFQRSHGRPPTPIETLQLAQQATLETREAKHEPRTLADQRAAWNREAIAVLGTPQRLTQMVLGALNPEKAAGVLADSKWFTQAADRIVNAMEGGRATWQYWHVYAEAQRQVRGANVPDNQVDQVVEMLVDEVLAGRSVSLARASDGIVEPTELRRVDGTSVYKVSGADLFTSSKVIDAEKRLVAAAGRTDGYRVEASSVDMALLESAANGVTLNAGQATLVREMATSGARLQLAIAPAGSGKTTAMRALAIAWADAGGDVIGLAPSAAAADALREQIDTTTDTLAKLTHSLMTGDVPEWIANIGPSTLVVIDEAGMADTLSLDAAVSYILEQGASVRLVGDDQQLAAIGAGGVLRDIQATHGALQLTELVRFRDPAEGAASLAMREGRAEALGFYLDRGRVHVGDLATMTEDVFGAWQADRAEGLDAIMLAPTRDLVSELNQRARAHRLDGVDPTVVGPEVRLSDGNVASVGELVITRTNDRKLRTSPTDFVKNGDRWTVLAIHDSGDLTVQHNQHGRTVLLPAKYVRESTELGYACTVHTAQGVTADTMHGLATGSESRQQLYTMLTRGKSGNHVYLEVVGDGDPHSVIHPTLVRPQTATDILESILARDASPKSASSLVREQASPAARLGEAAERYLDSLYVAAEHKVGPAVVSSLEETAEKILPGLTEEAAWPTLRAHLLLMGAAGENPAAMLRTAATDRELGTAQDRAAVLDWRLDSTGLRNAGEGPLPWMPAVPKALADDAKWGPYLTQRAQLVTSLAGEVRQSAAAEGALPVWAQNGLRPDEKTLSEVAVWRAAMQVDPADRRPTGPSQLQKAPATWQRRLNRAVTGDHTPALKEWRSLLVSVAPQIAHDEFTPLLAERLAAMSRAGVPARQLLQGAVTGGPLPDEHAAAALWWRMSRHLTPAVAAQVEGQEHVTTNWSSSLVDIFGAERAERIQASSWWPALVANVDHGLQRGWQLADLLSAGRAMPGDDIDECQALVWRTSIALEPIPDEHAADPHYDEAPHDMWDGVEQAAEGHLVIDPVAGHDPSAPVDAFPDPEWMPLEEEATEPDFDAPPEDMWDDWTPPADAAAMLDAAVVAAPAKTSTSEPEDDFIVADLNLAEMLRDLRGITELEQSDVDVRRMFARADEWNDVPVPRERMLEVNSLAQSFYEQAFRNSWASDYLTGRFGVDLAGDERFRPGLAPAGWDNLVRHLRREGVSDEEMIAVGVAKVASSGNLIDVFRNRVMFPVLAPGSGGTEVLGFAGRLNPAIDVDDFNPKYINTADTPLFHKGAQMFGHVDELIAEGATPVIVEGPMDAIAVTVATAGLYIGLAPMGTALTEEQATELARIGRDPIVATDGDLAGQTAAERDFWLLTPHGMDPGYAAFAEGDDPADVLTHSGPAALAMTLAANQPLGEHLLEERLENLPPEKARLAAAKILAARPGHAWDAGTSAMQARLQISQLQARRAVRDAVKTWDADPRKTAQRELANAGDVKARLQAAANRTPAGRWATLAKELDPRLVDQRDWPMTAQMIQDAHDNGHDVAAATKAMVAEAPLGAQPAKDLRYRLVSRLDISVDGAENTTRASSNGANQSRKQQPSPETGPQRGPRRR